MRSFVTSFLHTAVYPKSRDEDRARKEFVLNTLLLSVITVFALATLNNLIEVILGRAITLSLAALASVLVLLLGLYALARQGRILIASSVLLILLFVFATYLGIRWGIDVHAAVFFYIFTIIIAGSLLGSGGAFLIALCVVVSLLSIGTLQQSGEWIPNRFWAADIWSLSDLVVISIMFFTVAAVSWLTNREIEKSLQRARRSEAALMLERDQLEERVKERTQELHKAELDRMNQAYRFVEFGRLAGSIFHDLVNPLTALALNLESMAGRLNDNERVAMMKGSIKRAQSATNHMQELMNSMRRHLARTSSQEDFAPGTLLTEGMRMLQAYARARGVKLVRQIHSSQTLHADPIAFMQIVTNIISNAIESFEPIQHNVPLKHRTVTACLIMDDEQIVLRVEDTGIGMPPHILKEIFEPFFSTKGDAGLGIGLPLARRLLQKEFNGTILAESQLGLGTTITLYFPIRRP